MYKNFIQNRHTTDWIVSVNERLARFLIQQKLKLLPNQELAILTTETIFSANALIHNFWQAALTKGHSLPLIMTPLHEFSLWQSIIEEQTSNTLINAQDLARELQKTYHLMCQFAIDDDLIQPPMRYDTEEFMRWKSTFDASLTAHNWLSPANQITWLTQHVDLATLTLPAKIWLVGFTTLTPQLNQFFDALSAHGVAIDHFSPQTKTPKIQVTAYKDHQSELSDTLTQAHQQAQNPQKNIAIVLPMLHQQRARVIETAEAIFTASSTPNKHTPTYAITGGIPLKDFPIIHMAHQLLNAPRLKDLQKISQISRSPFIAHSQTEQEERALLDQTLNQGLLYNTSLKRYYVSLKHANPTLTLTKHMGDVLSHKLPKRAALNTWATYIKETLTLWGWPGERPLNSEEHQCVKRFYELLEQLCLLSATTKPLDFNQAMALFEHLLATEPFQSETKSVANVHIMGLLEIGGLPFDHIYVLSLTDQCFPGPSKPNPFIPLSLQKKYHLPHACAERETEFAESLLAQLNTQTSRLSLSYPKADEDIPLNISPLLKQYPLTTHETAQQFNPLPQLDSIEDTYGAIPDRNDIRGGSFLFKRQALCPFSAYASVSLRLKALPTPLETLNFIDRGSLAHKILEIFWQKTHDHDTLLTLTPKVIHEKIATLVQTALKQYQHHHPELLPEALLILEQKRLTEQLSDWLIQEQSRPPFKVIALEKTLHIDYFDIPLILCIDRIDKLAQGQELVIDYKTGQCNSGHWFKDRLIEPQLPLYALLTHAKGIAFAKISVNAAQFDGISDNKTAISGIYPLNKTRKGQYIHWDDQMNAWDQHLQSLATEFKQGYAAVDPISPQLACHTCEFKRLCRIEQ